MAVRSKRTLQQPSNVKGAAQGKAQAKWNEDAACRRAVEAFFNCLDRSCGGGGFVNESLALRVWPLLTHHVDGSRVHKLGRQLQKRVEPIGRDEWLALMDIVCNIGGMRLFMSSILNTWVLLEQGKLGDDHLEKMSVTSSPKSSLPPLRHPANASPSGLPVSNVRISGIKTTPLEQVSVPCISSSCEVSLEAEEAPPKPIALGTLPLPTSIDELLSSRVVHAQAESTTESVTCTLLEKVVVEDSLDPSIEAFPSHTEISALSDDTRTAVQEPSSLPFSLVDDLHASDCLMLSSEHVSTEICDVCSISAEPISSHEEVPVWASAEPHSSSILPKAPFAGYVACASPLLDGMQEHRCGQVAAELKKSQLQSRYTSNTAVTSQKHIENVKDRGQPSTPEQKPAERVQVPEESPQLLSDAPEAELPEESPLADPSEANCIDDPPQKRPASRSSKHKSSHMRRSSSQPLQPPARLAPLPRVPVAVPNVVRLANAIESWRAQHFMYHRIGNVVQAKKDFQCGEIEIKCGQRGRIVFVASEVYANILMESNSQVTQVPKHDLVNFDLHVVTHEVELIDVRGQRAGKFSACIVLKDHEDGFCDILCQDGRAMQNIHSAYLRELSVGMYTDVGYLTARSSCSSGSQRAHADLTKGNLLESSDCCRSDELQLPPEGFIGAVARSVGFATSSPLPLARCRSQLNKRHEEDHREDFGHAHLRAPGMEDSSAPGTSVCPFMEIQDGGLRAFIALSNFSVNDVVVDIGCGHGKILNKILECCPCQGIGVEVSPSIARVAKQNLRKYAGRAEVITNDICNLDLQCATVTVSYLLSHSFDTNHGALKEHLSKSLRPGSVVLNYTYPVLGWTGCLQNGIHKYVIGEHLPR